MCVILAYIQLNVVKILYVVLLQNAALCIVFALGFFAGGVANAVFANENADNVDDITFICGYDLNACNHLKQVRDSEVATAVS